MAEVFRRAQLAAELANSPAQSCLRGATSLPYPVLDEAYVTHVLQRLGDDAAMVLPSLPVGGAAWWAGAGDLRLGGPDGHTGQGPVLR